MFVFQIIHLGEFPAPTLLYIFEVQNMFSFSGRDLRQHLEEGLEAGLGDQAHSSNDQGKEYIKLISKTTRTNMIIK